MSRERAEKSLLFSYLVYVFIYGKRNEAPGGLNVKKTKVAVISGSSFTDEDLMPFARLLAEGGTVAFPTETVYGLGADATNPDALAAVFQAKGRPSDNPLIVHVAAIEWLDELTETVTPLARQLIHAFWPGPLTLILKKSPKVPEQVTAGLDTVALRIPAHPLASRLIALAGVPVAAPSANRSGRPSPTQGSHVIKDLMGRVDAIIDGGSCDVGLESTVVDATGTIPVILRPGGVTMEMLKAVAGKVVVDQGLLGMDHASLEPARSPGMKYAHYAPRAPLILGDEKELETLWHTHHDRHRRIGLLCTEEAAEQLKTAFAGETAPPLMKILGSLHRPDIMAARLFQMLREFDDSDVTLILAQRLPEEALGFALMNRLQKAAGSQQQTAPSPKDS